MIHDKIDSLEKAVNNIQTELDKFEKDIEKLEIKLDKILHILEDKIQLDCTKMSDHIDFIDNVYAKMQSPLWYICNKVKMISGTGTKSLDC